MPIKSNSALALKAKQFYNEKIVAHVLGYQGENLDQSMAIIEAGFCDEDDLIRFFGYPEPEPGIFFGRIAHCGLITGYPARSLLDSASRLAAGMHADADQRRKYTNEPYINHPREVADIVSRYTDDEVTIAAAWLHDVIEDTKYDETDIDFLLDNKEVSRLVLEVSDVSKKEDGNRATRKALDRAHLAKASPAGKLIKLADCLSNAKSIMAHDPKFAVTYLDEMRELFPLIKDGCPQLANELHGFLLVCHELPNSP